MIIFFIKKSSSKIFQKKSLKRRSSENLSFIKFQSYLICQESNEKINILHQKIFVKRIQKISLKRRSSEDIFLADFQYYLIWQK